jgi:hypothetical protein
MLLDLIQRKARSVPAGNPIGEIAGDSERSARCTFPGTEMTE